jgi:hypothetical protein
MVVGLGSPAVAQDAQAALQVPSRPFLYVCGGADPRAFAERRLAAASGSGEVAKADRALAETALRRIAELRNRLALVENVEEPYADAARFARLSAGADNLRLRELFRRASNDQFSRGHLVAAQSGQSWASDLTPSATDYVIAMLSDEQCNTDPANTAWLKADIAANGWMRISTMGADADLAAFLIVQHSDADPEFQTFALNMMEQLLPQRETRRQNFAMLFDRVAVAQKKPQRYGTQGQCTGSGVWEELPVEDPARIDALRAGVDLEPLADYRRRFTAVCGD